jgi:hypothetical protein
MGTVNALLLFAEPNTNWVNATFVWATSTRSIFGLPSQTRHPDGMCPSLAARDVFLASREVLILAQPEAAGGNEVGK